MRVLIDTCVVIDAMRDREPFAMASQQTFLAIDRGYCKGYITANQLTDLHYLMHKELHNEEKTVSALRGLCTIVSILDTTSEDCLRALGSGRTDLEDSLEIETAKREEIDYIVTRNIRDFTDSPIPVYTPEQFVAKFLK